jgi:hypothetical protein
VTESNRSDEQPPHGSRVRSTPYQGLVPYSEEDAEYFFGRTAWRGIITDHVLAYRIAVLYGSSGVGKSSVLRAGVVYDLRKAAARNLELTGRAEILPAFVSTWSGDPVASVEAALVAGAAQLSPELAHSPPLGSLAEVITGWANRVGGRVLLIVDQFDEYFMYHERKPGGLAFVDQLSAVAEDHDIPLNVLISIREDALSKLDRFSDASLGLWQNLLAIDQLDYECAREAIEKPIEQWNANYPTDNRTVTLEDGLVEAVLAEADARAIRIGDAGRGFVDDASEPSRAGGSVEAPYLQLVMTTLWEEERHRGSRTIRVATLRRLGGSEQIVRRHFDNVMRSLPRRQRGRASKLLEYLVTPTGTKIALPPSALAKWTKQKERTVTPILETLAGGNQRILRTVSVPGDTTGATSYEIFHDRLAAGILDWRRRSLRRRRRRRGAVLALAVLGAGASLIVYQRAQIVTLQASQRATTISGIVLNSRTPRGEYLDYTDQSKAGYSRAELGVVGASAFARVQLVGYRGRTVTFRRQIVNAVTGKVVGTESSTFIPKADRVTRRFWEWAPLPRDSGRYVMTIKVLDDQFQLSTTACTGVFDGLTGELGVTPAPRTC